MAVSKPNKKKLWRLGSARRQLQRPTETARGALGLIKAHSKLARRVLKVLSLLRGADSLGAHTTHSSQQNQLVAGGHSLWEGFEAFKAFTPLTQ